MHEQINRQFTRARFFASLLEIRNLVVEYVLAVPTVFVFTIDQFEHTERPNYEFSFSAVKKFSLYTTNVPTLTRLDNFRFFIHHESTLIAESG